MAEGAAALSASAPLLELDQVTKSFGRVVVADGLSLAIGDGEAVGIVGPNGAGKTSLFGLISGDLAPSSGQVRFSGATVTRLDAAARCRLGIGRTYQVPRPFGGMSVFENVLVAAAQGGRLRGRASHLRALGVLERTGLLQEGNTPAERLGLLQRKRLELARALASGPRLLLLDEVAGGLTDAEVAELVVIVTAVRAEGAAVLWIEHVVRALTPAVDRLICLASGKFIGDGSPREVLASPEVREVFLGTEVTTSLTAGDPAWGAGVGNPGEVPLLEVRGLTVHHGQLRAVADVSLSVASGDVHAIIGANGAGKSTLLRTISGLHRPTAGTILLDGADVTRQRPERRAAAGIVMVPEGRRLFPSLSVEENLLVGASYARPGPWSIGRVYELFGWMRDRRRQRAAQLSGGEQQAVAIGRALVANPRVLLLDELSLGLAPAVVQRIYGLLPDLLSAGLTVLLVEQDVSQAVRVATSVQCLLEGRTTLEGKPADLSPEQIEKAYFGLDSSPAQAAASAAAESGSPGEST